MLAFRERQEGKPGPQDNDQVRPAAVSWDEVTGRLGELITLPAEHAPHRLCYHHPQKMFRLSRAGASPAGPRPRARRLAAGLGEGRTRGAQGLERRQRKQVCGPGSGDVGGHVITRGEHPGKPERMWPNGSRIRPVLSPAPSWGIRQTLRKKSEQLER